MVSLSIQSYLVSPPSTAKKFAYAPYSNLNVGAAILAVDGTIFTGTNVENIAYGEPSGVLLLHLFLF